MINVSVKKLRDNAIMPFRGSDCAAGYDLFAAIESDVVIESGKTAFIPTGLSMEIPDGYFGGIYARSGLSCKEGLRPANCVGVLDSDYRGELMVALHNDSEVERTVTVGQKIAQLVIQPYLAVAFNEVDELCDTTRGAGGFGSTGK